MELTAITGSKQKVAKTNYFNRVLLNFFGVTSYNMLRIPLLLQH